MCTQRQSSTCACPSGANGAQVCSNGAFGPCTCSAPVETRTSLAEDEGATAVVVSPVDKSSSVSIALVMNAWEMWIGNDKEVPELKADDPMRFPGILIDLRAALDKNRMSSGPPGSLGMVITFGDKPVIRVPMGPLANITGKSLGSQKDYFGETGVELVSGLRLALSELAKVPTARRVLIVVCDGNDTNNDAAMAELAKLKKKAAQLDVQTFAIVYKAPLSADPNILPAMIPDTTVITSGRDVDSAVAAIVAKIK